MRLWYSCRDYDEAIIVLKGIPLSYTSSFLKGGYLSYQNFLWSSETLEKYEPEFDIELKRVYDDGEMEIRFEIERDGENIRRETKKHLLNHKTLILIGVEHTITPFSFREFHNSFEKIYLVVLDAHRDMRDSYYGNRWSHATAMRRVLDFLPEERLIQIGVRAWDKEEKANNPFFPFHLFKYMSEVKKMVKDEDVYLSIDMDIIDPIYFPAVNTPEPGGVNHHEFMEFLKEFILKFNVKGIDLVEFNPDAGLPAHHVFFADVVKKIIALILKKKGGKE